MPATLLRRYIDSHVGSYITSTALALAMCAADALTPRSYDGAAPVFRLVGENSVPSSVVVTLTLVMSLHALLIVAQSFRGSTRAFREFVMVLVRSLESFFSGALWLTAWLAFYGKGIWMFPVFAYGAVAFLIVLRWLSIGKTRVIRWIFRIGYSLLFVSCILEAIMFLWRLK